MWYITRRYIHLALWSWGPPLAAMAAMFLASAQPKYGPPGQAAFVYFSGAMPVFPGVWDALIKKSGHVLAFGVLALLNLRALLAWRCSLRRAVCLALLLTLGYAFLDEIHQAFVPGRHPSLLDVGLDSIGAVLFTFAHGKMARQRTNAP